MPTQEKIHVIDFKSIKSKHGMSAPELLLEFFTAASAQAQYSEPVRWPEAFRAPAVITTCLTKVLELLSMLWLQASNSLTAGILMANTKLPLATWLLGIHLISQARTGLSALWLKRHLGVSDFPTRLHQKRRQAMASQDANHQFSGGVQHDDADIAGKRASGMIGSGSENSSPFAAAKGNLMFIYLNVIKGFTSKVMSKWGRWPIWQPPPACKATDRASWGRFPMQDAFAFFCR